MDAGRRITEQGFWPDGSRPGSGRCPVQGSRAVEIVLRHEHVADPERRGRLEHQAQSQSEPTRGEREERLGGADVRDPRRRGDPGFPSQRADHLRLAEPGALILRRGTRAKRETHHRTPDQIQLRPCAGFCEFPIESFEGLENRRAVQRFHPAIVRTGKPSRQAWGILLRPGRLKSRESGSCRRSR